MPMTSASALRRPGRSVVAAAAVGGMALTSVLVAGSAARADSFDTVHAAAYLGADSVAETSLPETLSTNGADVPVSWEIDDDAFTLPYATVEVTGSAGKDTVSAVVEVIPPAEHPLVYFVDAGHNGDSQDRWYSDGETNSNAFTAVDTLAATTLHNTVPDQPYEPEANDWGYTYEVSNGYKISVPGGDPASGADLGDFGKYELGVRTNTDALTFALVLDPGTYTLSSGFFEFYAAGQDRYRKIDPTISYVLDGAHVSTPLGSVALSTSADNPKHELDTHVLTVPEGAADVRLSYVKSGGEAPILSWFAIAEGDAKDVLDDAAGGDPANAVAVTIDAADIASDNRNGLTFKGFGALSANSTSAVLMDYKSENPEAYAELLRTLFGGDHPIMNQVKIEMGNDRNNSTGPDPATMRSQDEPANVTRHPGFQLAADAKKVNPGLKISILRWNAPAWANNNDKIYTWYKNTILAAYREYGYMVDYVNPGVNEQRADYNWTKRYAELVRTDDTGYVSDDPELAGFRDGEADLYHDIQVVISDEVSVGSFGGAMIADEDLRSAVDVAGYHYSPNDDSAGNFTRLAEEFDKEIWNSEAQATFSNTSFRPHNNTADPTTPGTGIGGTGSALEMANTIVKGFVNSRRTHFVYQPSIGSFFEGGQYSFKELVSARDPWSGWVHYDGGLAVLQHFANFATTGWEDDANSAGIWRAIPQASDSGAAGQNPVVGRNGEPNYLTMAAPDGSDFSTVIVNDSEYPLTYRLAPVGFELDGAPLATWETRAADEGEAFDSGYKRFAGDVAPAGGVYTVTVEPFSIVTVTSLDVSSDEQWTSPLPVEGERTVLDDDPDAGVLWSDDFDYTGRTVPLITAAGEVGPQSESFVDSRGGATGLIPLFTWDRNGAFEAYEADDGWVLRQQVDAGSTGVGGAWNGGDPITAIGDRRWTNYRASVDVRFERSTASGNYAAVGARTSGGDNSQSLNSSGYVLRLDRDGAWQVQRRGTVVESGSITDVGTDWHELSLQVAGDRVTAWIDGDEVVDWTDPTPIRSGWVDLASGFHHTQFDDVSIERVPGFVPYYGEYLDGLEMTNLSEDPATKLVYTGAWDHANGASMYDYQRSSSISRATGATVSYTFTGTGLDIIGAGDGSARLDVYSDGEIVETNARTQSSGQFQQSYALRGLEYGEHTVTIEVASGSLSVDAVGVVSVRADEPAATDAVAAELARAEAVERSEDFTDATWRALQHAIAAARSAVADPAAYALDKEGAAALAQRLRAGSAPLWSQIVSVEPVHVATETGVEPELPATVTATLVDESTRELAVDWDLSDLDLSAPWTSQQVPAIYGAATVSGTVEVVPAGAVLFVDLNGADDGSLGYTSPAYTAIAALVGDDLLTDQVDQPFDGAWGHWGKNAAGNDEVHYKGIVSGPYNKLTTTGVYTANGRGSQLGYTATLPAGDYTLAFGSHSWWADYSRTAEVVLTYDGEEHIVDTVTLDRSTPSRELSFPVTLAEDGPLTLTLRNTSDQSPMLSWVGISESAPEAPVAASVTWRCVAGRAVLVARVEALTDIDEPITVQTDYGSSRIDALADGRAVARAYTTRQVATDAGTVELAVGQWDGSIDHGAFSCG